uniref:Prolyl 4-hydroxylase alpha subunit domain-containing protein n=1 Tax=Chromera velia CCMP2878 TaxID=1169474 RepID=A0A0G4G370_9ALVE|eukprot:Cvel_19986.t1-p1 / transcript=Cvel_19986.t1 / gene=Cvel_19986 / organism=Chromera_velia_CCMP2878 / gene_product=hypothetical protein / transcript_product=hypothetical protein / location=Cvel_scaffold1761:11466-14262(+) / protein_length=506 / sequence_SO=supercontig / SO=protein_coding / is_pseudo=false
MERTLQSLSPPLDSVLSSLGFAAVDGLFGHDFCFSVAEEIDRMEASKWLSVSGHNCIGQSCDGRMRRHSLEKPQIREADVLYERKLRPPQSQAGDGDGPSEGGTEDEFGLRCPLLHRFCTGRAEEFASILRRWLPSLRLSSLEQVKAQANVGDGGCFPLHVDSSVKTSKRHLTMVLYLNEGRRDAEGKAEWPEEWGGQIRMGSLPLGLVDVPPLLDRIVFFCSHDLPHRVMPASVRRKCLSLWMDAEEPNLFPHSPQSLLKLPTPPQSLTALFQKGPQWQTCFSAALRAENRDVVAKVLFGAEWGRSLREAFLPPPGATDRQREKENETRLRDAVEEVVRFHSSQLEKLERALDAVKLPIQILSSAKEGKKADSEEREKSPERSSDSSLLAFVQSVLPLSVDAAFLSAFSDAYAMERCTWRSAERESQGPLETATGSSVAGKRIGSPSVLGKQDANGGHGVSGPQNESPKRTGSGGGGNLSNLKDKEVDSEDDEEEDLEALAACMG